MGRLSMRLRELSTEPSVAVVMAVRDAADVLGAAVSAALRQKPVQELVIAVGPSSDDTAARAAELATVHQQVRVVANPTGTTPDGLNRAIAATSADVIVRVDGHSVLPPGYVERAVETLRRTGAGNVGGRQVPRGRGGFEAAVAAAMQSPIGSGGARYRAGGSAGPADTVYLGVFRREAVEAVGAYDLRFLRNQDAELNERLRRAGFVVWFDPELAVDYRPRATLKSLARQYFQYGRYRRLTSHVHRGSLRLRQLAPLALLATLACAVTIGIATESPWPLVVVMVGYLATLLAAGIVAGGVSTSHLVAIALATMHVSWALGFLVGPPSKSPPAA